MNRWRHVANAYLIWVGMYIFCRSAMQVVQLTPLQHCIVYDRFRVVVILPCASLFVRTPTLLKLLKDSLSKKSRKRKFSKQKHLGLVTVICKILNIYNQNLNGLSKINGLRMSRAGMTKRSIREFNQTYDTVSYQTINRVLDSFAKKSVARVRNVERSQCFSLRRQCGQTDKEEAWDGREI